MKKRNRFSQLVLRLAVPALLLAACSTSSLEVIQEPQKPALFGDADIDSAALELAPIEEAAVAEGGEVPDGLESELGEALQDGLSSQAVLPGASGVILYFLYDPDRTNPWQIWLADQKTDTRTLVYAGTRQIQSVAATANGSTIVMTMRPSASSAYEVYRFNVRPPGSGTIARLTSTPTPEFAVSISADGRFVVWQGTDPDTRRSAFFVRDMVANRTRMFANGTAEQLQPSISGDGKHIAFLRYPVAGTAGDKRVMLYDRTANRYTTVATSANGFEHPSPSNGGLKVAWLEWRDSGNRIRVKTMASGNISNVVTGSSSEIDKPHLTADGRFMTYSGPPFGTRIYARDLSTGATVEVARGAGAFWQKVHQPPAVSSGADHSCGVTSGGEARCWGVNGFGQLGDGTTALRSRPVTVAGGYTFSTVSSGPYHSCALTPEGEAYCWGFNHIGQLGDGTTAAPRTRPVRVADGHTFASISVGALHSCAVTRHGAAYCWGHNDSGQLGDGTTTTSSRPVRVTGGHTFASIAGGYGHSCGITTSFAAYCWGGGWAGQLGNGRTANSSSPVLVAGGLRFTSISSGNAHSCAVATDALAYCWGHNGNGQLGDTTTTNRSRPVGVASADTPRHLHATAISSGYSHSCAVSLTMPTYCWGANANGQLGDGTTTRRTVATRIQGRHILRDVSGGGNHSCGLDFDGAVFCWGSNRHGQFGNGTTTSSSVPVRGPSLAP